MFVALIFWYQFYCGFSGSGMIDQWYLIFFNLMFSAFPQLITGTLDKDVSAETLQQLPQLYVNGQNSEVGFFWKCCVFWSRSCSAAASRDKSSNGSPENAHLALCVQPLLGLRGASQQAETHIVVRKHQRRKVLRIWDLLLQFF